MGVDAHKSQSWKACSCMYVEAQAHKPPHGCHAGPIISVHTGPSTGHAVILQVGLTPTYLPARSSSSQHTVQLTASAVRPYPTPAKPPRSGLYSRRKQICQEQHSLPPSEDHMVFSMHASMAALLWAPGGGHSKQLWPFLAISSRLPAS